MKQALDPEQLLALNEVITCLCEFLNVKTQKGCPVRVPRNASRLPVHCQALRLFLVMCGVV